MKIIKRSDSFEFTNPGILKLPLEDIYRGGNSKSRNPHMQTMLRMVGFGDNAGSGFSSILAAWKEEGWIKPQLIEDTSLNQVTLHLKMIPDLGEEFLLSLNKEDIFEIFHIADKIQEGNFKGFLNGKSIVLFFPNTSIRTRVTFEKGIYLLGGQPILFPPETLDKKEKLEDVCGYLNNWADAVIVRHRNMDVIRELVRYSTVPIINAMTDINHPCEIISDMYSLSKLRVEFTKDKYLFCGKSSNIGLLWKEAANVL